MKLSPDPKSKKDTDDLTVLFALLESACINDARKHVGEIDLKDLDFIFAKVTT